MRKVTERDKEKATELIGSIYPVKGEKRTVQKCSDCGELFGRRFIPFGIGQGLTVNPCLCQVTGHRPSVRVLEIKD